MTEILINATFKDQKRVAIVNNQTLQGLYIEHSGQEQRKSNIYKGVIYRIEPSLRAVFVDYGEGRHGFLPLKEISPEYFLRQADGDIESTNIRDLLKEGQEIVVQVEKEERGNKRAALTTFLSLAGCYLVLYPNNANAGGISRQIEGDDRAELRNVIAELKFPPHMGLIVRTAGLGRSLEELQWDVDVLLRLWDAIVQAVQEKSDPLLIYREGDVIVKTIRDYLRDDVSSIMIDDPETFKLAQQQIAHLRPNFANRVKLYQDPLPLFTRYQIENQIETAFQREVKLSSGGAIVIDHTEALVSIDINSARSTGGSDIEETALHTNLQAASEIARQLRLRDIGGLIVIDFIDMTSASHQRQVEDCVREALKADRARVQVGRISRFGLLEMSRQRLGNSLGESHHFTCPRCEGRGSIRHVESLAISILRLVEEAASKERTSQINLHVPVDVATFLLNEKRDIIASLEARQKITIYVIPNPHMETPHYKIDRVRASDTEKNQRASYELREIPEPVEPTAPSSLSRSEEPVVKNLMMAVPQAPQPTSPSLMKRIWSSLFGSSSQNTAKQEVSKIEESPDTGRRPRQGGGRRHGNYGQRNNNRQQGQSSGQQTQGQGGQQRRRGGRNNNNPNAGSGRAPQQRRSNQPRRDYVENSVNAPTENRDERVYQVDVNPIPIAQPIERPIEQQRPERTQEVVQHRDRAEEPRQAPQETIERQASNEARNTPAPEFHHEDASHHEDEHDNIGNRAPHSEENASDEQRLIQPPRRPQHRGRRVNRGPGMRNQRHRTAPREGAARESYEDDGE